MFGCFTCLLETDDSYPHFDGVHGAVDPELLELLRADGHDTSSFLDIDELERALEGGMGMPADMPSVPSQGITPPSVQGGQASGNGSGSNITMQHVSSPNPSAQPGKKRVRSQEQKQKNSVRQAQYRAKKQTE
eukprot:CAMPEP_0202878744 /NCGR_PEP_ID=MMETSP1391-20130828/32667_1 /ASSEMBLY_ACC=CAM_ASM_000867 /TAXON_ID=1034604 /ORGANISM="Chlamydomonas leiostraca, Strain SAG 11-49" /LENGTH=132 /DNA_ID=CAMNT_0049560991 /DNA_START=91 /DNA_END=486 /DNA_ORIENTATION=-